MSFIGVYPFNERETDPLTLIDLLKQIKLTAKSTMKKQIPLIRLI